MLNKTLYAKPGYVRQRDTWSAAKFRLGAFLLVLGRLF
jgi:hypothetical protein